MYSKVHGMKSTQTRYNRNLPNLKSHATLEETLQRYRDMEEEVDPEMSAWRKAHRARMYDSDSLYRTVIQAPSYLYNPLSEQISGDHSILFTESAIGSLQPADEKSECNDTQTYINKQLEQHLSETSFHIAPPPAPSDSSVYTTILFDFGAVAQCTNDSIKHNSPGLLHLSPLLAATKYSNDITIDEDNQSDTPLLSRDSDMSGTWKYLAIDGSVCDNYQKARVNGGSPRCIWASHDDAGQLDQSGVSSSCFPKPGSVYSASLDGPGDVKGKCNDGDCPGYVKWQTNDGYLFDTFGEAYAHGLVSSEVRFNTQRPTFYDEKVFESDDGTDDSVNMDDDYDEDDDDDEEDDDDDDAAEPACSKLDSSSQFTYLPTITVDDPKEQCDDDSNNKSDNKTLVRIDSHARADARANTGNPAWTNIDGYVSPDYRPSTPVDRPKKPSGDDQAHEYDENVHDRMKRPTHGRVTRSATLFRRAAASHLKDEIEDGNGEWSLKHYSYVDSAFDSPDPLDGDGSPAIQVYTSPRRNSNNEAGDNHRSKLYSDFSLDGAAPDSSSRTLPECGRRFKTPEDMYDFYANDYRKSCVVTPLTISRNVSGNMPSKVDIDSVGQSATPSPEEHLPDVSFSDAASHTGKPSADSPISSDSSFSTSATLSTGSAIPSDGCWIPIMDDIEDMLKKEPTTDFKWSTNVPIQSTKGQTTTFHVPEDPNNTSSCAVSVESVQIDTFNAACIHDSGMDFDHDVLPTRYYSKDLFGNKGWLDQSKFPITNKRRLSSGLKSLGQTVKAHVKDLALIMSWQTGESKRARITTSNASIAIEVTAALSLSIETQVKLYAELEYLIVTTANRFLMHEYYDGNISDLSIRRLNKEWISKNRPGVPEFCFDQSTQRELIFANRQSVKFGGGACANPMLLHAIFSNWKSVCVETNVRSFCLPDSAVRKHLHDIEGILELLNAPSSTMEAMQTLAMRTREEILQVRASRIGRGSFGAGDAPDASSVPSTPSTPVMTLSSILHRTNTASSGSRSSRTPQTPQSRRRQGSRGSFASETPLPLSRDEVAAFEHVGRPAELSLERSQYQMALQAKSSRCGALPTRERGRH
ncbi:uncharacterized protein N7511_008751 [Penicillium nucicola]|uniref:uncharacterized protein n=1 Tax=Penicillium nucicola TaxID=1850975 RepID=UPI0025456EAA|nr:uncharacterized protein N7511_008751 [Penicillium nucicola]KAJ5747055.1 hypothetical protein N7511_008751 [Penicillium nucicola]